MSLNLVCRWAVCDYKKQFMEGVRMRIEKILKAMQ